MANLYKGVYYQGNLTDADCENILQVLSTNCIEGLKHSICDLTPYEITCVLKEKYAYAKPVEYNGVLRDEQTVGTAYMYYAKSVLLGDEVGLGKTVEVAALVNILKQTMRKHINILFLAESTSVVEIRNKMIQFTGCYIDLLQTGEERNVKHYIEDVDERNDGKWSVVAPHSVMRSNLFLSFCATHDFDVVVFDESSALRSNKGISDIYRNTKLLFDRTPRKILLNATPLEVTLRDFYNQLRLLDPDFLPLIGDFEHLYCVKKRVQGRYKIVGAKNLDVLRKAISLRYIARTRVELGAVYEDNVVNLYALELSDVQKKLKQRTSLWQQLFDYPPSIMFDVDASIQNVPKIWTLLHILSKLDVTQEQVLIYCKYVACQARVAEILTEYGYKVAVLNGSTKSKERTAILEGMRRQETSILITNTMRSIDMSYCKHCILYTIDTLPQRAVQVEGRITRDFDVVGKTLWLLCMQGRELKSLYGLAKDRAQMAKEATVHSKSMYLDLLLENKVSVYNVASTSYAYAPEDVVVVQDTKGETRH